MQTGKINSTTFTGYGPMRLRAICLTRPLANVSMELAEIGKKANFDVFVGSRDRLLRPCDLKNWESLRDSNPWAQDVSVVTPDNRVTAGTCNVRLAKLMAEKFFGGSDKLELGLDPPMGGNLFFVKDLKGKMELLAGANCAQKDNIDLKRFYGVDKVHYIPQMDFHLDVFMRPLDNGRVLVADDDLTSNVLSLGMEKIEGLLSRKNVGFFKKIKLKEIKENLNNKISKFASARADNPYKSNTKDICDTLQNLGYKPIRVPGRLYNVGKSPYGFDALLHDVNYMNAIVPVGKDGQMHYITNKSLIDEEIKLTPELSQELDYSFEKEFLKSIEGLFLKDNIYFMRGNNDIIPNILKSSRGGIHCLASEVPELFANNKLL